MKLGELAIKRRDGQDLPSVTEGLFLLFPAGKRPATDDVEQALSRSPAPCSDGYTTSADPADPGISGCGDSGFTTNGSSMPVVSHDPRKNTAPVKALAHGMPEYWPEYWLELLMDGLTFDLHGLSPGAGANMPQILHSIDCMIDGGQTGNEALELRVGPHISGGGWIMPVLRKMLHVGRILSERLDMCKAVVWGPAAVAISPAAFAAALHAWSIGGPFPAMALTGFDRAVDGVLQSRGLTYFTGQELRLGTDLAGDETTTLLLAGRLVNQLVMMGKVEESHAITGPDGSPLQMEPSGNGQYVRVRRG